MTERPDYHDPKKWPELQPVPKTSHQAFAEKMVEVEVAESRKPLIRRVRVLMAAVAVAVFSAAQTLVIIIPELWRGSGAFDALATPLAAFNAVVQVAASGYFVVGKDPDFAAQVVKLLLIFNGLELLMGLAFAGSLVLTLLEIVLLYLAYQKLESLRRHRF